ncbi:MAG: hypothetical protein HY868_23860 [Chloroflexi bacterium]|nr:hypothetical protein [Chloroflexota bacterium]
MRRTIPILVSLLFLLVAVILGLQAELPGFTQLELTDPETGRTIFSAALRDGEPVVLTWHNSIFDLDVTEEFTATNGMLIEHAVTFADPRGTPPMVAAPQDLDDLFHTGGPFAVRGIAKPFTRITYRIGEIGNPQFHIRDRVIALKPEVGFGGRVTLTTHRARVRDLP